MEYSSDSEFSNRFYRVRIGNDSKSWYVEKRADNCFTPTNEDYTIEWEESAQFLREQLLGLSGKMKR